MDTEHGKYGCKAKNPETKEVAVLSVNTNNPQIFIIGHECAGRRKGREKSCVGSLCYSAICNFAPSLLRGTHCSLPACPPCFP